MRISRIFRLGKSQYELDFVDIDPRHDIPLFVDPYFLSTRTDHWSSEASRTIKSFFEHFTRLIRAGDAQGARQLFERLGEPNETCLGLSKGRPQGRGIGETNATKIFESLIATEAVRAGVVEDIEDCRIFVEGVDKDLISDMATNIIKGHLIQYTQAQCQLWNIPLQPGVPSGFVWSRLDGQWTNVHTDMLIVDGKKLLLVPKAIVSFSEKYTAQQYHQHFVLNFLQNEHLRMNSVLVQRRRRRDGSERVFVTKKSVREYDAPLTKEFLARFTQQHPEVFRNFRERTRDKIQSVDNEELSNSNLRDIAEYLVEELRSIPAGPENATRYHRTIVGILELLFYPNLFSPQIEGEIHEGRKRIDITFDNGAKDGFFFRLHTTYQTPSQFILVECKNYSRDVANPELDQIAGRFSPNRGRFGIIVCRTIDDMQTLLARCSDTYRDQRGTILPIVDADLIALLQQLANGDRRPEEEFLANRFRQIALQ